MIHREDEYPFATIETLAGVTRLLPFPPVDPGRSLVRFPNPMIAGPRHILAMGVDLSPPTLLEAYRNGIFPWPRSEDIVPWCSPNPRAYYPLQHRPFHWSRSLRRTLRSHRFVLTMDCAFRDVMTACASVRAHEGTWIVPEMIEGYCRLHELGWAHSLEVWLIENEKRVLVGGIYGVAIGAVFAGESMFHLVTDASKIAFATLCESLAAADYQFFDVQVQNPHLQSLGCKEIPRVAFLQNLARLLTQKTKRLTIIKAQV